MGRQLGNRNAKRPGSATLKLSKRTVMLYESRYDRAAKATRQTYVAGFSRNATEIPAAFMKALARLTMTPERREQMLARIEAEVLAPARERAAEIERRRAQLAALAPVAAAGRAVGRAVRCLDEAEASPERDAALASLQDTCAGVAALQPHAPSPSPTDIDGAIAAFAGACAQLTAAVRALPKGAALKAATVNAWQRSWYVHQDMQAAVTSRAALKRPAGWSRPRVRALVEQGLDAHEGLRLDAECNGVGAP